MGYKTANIDHFAKEGAMFTDWYGQQSCTAGRAAFITGQTPFRTGLLKVGLPGAYDQGPMAPVRRPGSYIHAIRRGKGFADSVSDSGTRLLALQPGTIATQRIVL